MSPCVHPLFSAFLRSMPRRAKIIMRRAAVHGLFHGRRRAAVLSCFQGRPGPFVCSSFIYKRKRPDGAPAGLPAPLRRAGQAAARPAAALPRGKAAAGRTARPARALFSVRRHRRARHRQPPGAQPPLPSRPARAAVRVTSPLRAHASRAREKIFSGA